MTNLTAKVIRLRQTPEESILQVFIPDYQHDVDDDYHDHHHDCLKIVDDHIDDIDQEEEDGGEIELDHMESVPLQLQPKI